MVKKYLIAFVLFALIYAGAVIATGVGINPAGIHWDFENSGQFSDSFGPFSAAMSSIAALVAFLTYSAQRKELALAREDSKREHIESSKRDFETIFFQLIGLHREICNNIDVGNGENPHQGTDAFLYLVGGWFINNSSENNYEQQEEKFKRFYSQYKNDLGHYLRFDYHVINFIDKSNVDDKMFYIRIFRATLSNSEMLLIALNCMHGSGKEKLKPLVEKYALLHNISSLDAEKVFAVENFERSAFGDRSFSADGRLIG